MCRCEDCPSCSVFEPTSRRLTVGALEVEGEMLCLLALLERAEPFTLRPMKLPNLALAFTGVVFASAPLAQAQVVEGTTSGVFLNPDGPDGFVADGVATSQLTWGTASGSGATANSLSYQGSSFQMPLDQRQPVGLITYTNGRTTSGTNIDSVDVSIAFTLTLPSGEELLQPFTLGIDTTSNNSSEVASSDSLRLLTPYSGLEIVDGDEVYAIRLFFGEVGANAVGESEQVILLEDATTTVPLDAIACETILLDETSSVLTFEAVRGGSGLVVDGEGTSEITTGTPSGSSGAASVYTVLPQTGSEPRTEIPFVAGTLRYFNGSVATGSAAEGVSLSVDLGAQLGAFDFPLQFITTTNNSNARESADIILIENPIASRLVEIEGVLHTARLAFSNPTTGGFTNVSRFAVEESQSAEAEIVVVITRFITEELPFCLTVTRLAGEELLLSWPSEVGATYQLKSSFDLQEFLDSGDEIIADNTSTLVTRSLSSEQQFYRVIRVPEP